MIKDRTVGFWVLMSGSMLLLVMLVLGQAMAFINYDFAVSIGLQEAEGVIGQIGVAVNKGFGVADTLIYMPLLLAGIVGLWMRKRWGVSLMSGAMGITAYWPMVSLFLLLFAKGTPGFYFTNYISYSIILSLFTLFGLSGLFILYNGRRSFAED